MGCCILVHLLMVTHRAVGGMKRGNQHDFRLSAECFMLLFAKKKKSQPWLYLITTDAQNTSPFSYARMWEYTRCQQSLRDREQLVSLAINCWELFMSTAVIMQTNLWVMDTLMGFTGGLGGSIIQIYTNT